MGLRQPSRRRRARLGAQPDPGQRGAANGIMAPSQKDAHLQVKRAGAGDSRPLGAAMGSSRLFLQTREVLPQRGHGLRGQAGMGADDGAPPPLLVAANRMVKPKPEGAGIEALWGAELRSSALPGTAGTSTATTGHGRRPPARRGEPRRVPARGVRDRHRGPRCGSPGNGQFAGGKVWGSVNPSLWAAIGSVASSSGLLRACFSKRLGVSCVTN
jgi:hypothetical protein